MNLWSMAVIAGSMSLTPWIKLFQSDPIPVSAPKDVMALIRDYVHEKPSLTGKNQLGGEMRLDSISSDYLCLRPTQASCYQGVLLTPGEGERRDSVIMTLYTLYTPSANTQVRFYNGEAQPLSSSTAIFKAPTVADFVTSVDAQQMVTPVVISYEWKPDEHLLVAQLLAKDYLTPEVYQRVQPYLKESISYRWDGERFALVTSGD